MKNSIFKSIGAVLAGLVLVIVASTATDAILEKTGMMKLPFSDNSVGYILFVILYRNIFGAAGSYLAASLAPSRPMRHAMILGGLGFLLSLLGAIFMREQGPSWYADALVVLALPAAWLGGKWFLRNNPPG